MCAQKHYPRATIQFRLSTEVSEQEQQRVLDAVQAHRGTKKVSDTVVRDTDRIYTVYTNGSSSGPEMRAFISSFKIVLEAKITARPTVE